MGHCLGFLKNATNCGTTLSTATSPTIMTSNNGSSPTAIRTSTDISDSLDANYTAIDSMTTDGDPSNCYVGPDGVSLLCDGDIHSPFATCDGGFVPLFAKMSKDTYTVCCNETYWAKGTVYDKGGFSCCATTYQVNCEHAQSVTGCVSDETHKITQEEVSGVQVCKGEAERNSQRMLKGFGWMMVLWTLCISGFWGMWWSSLGARYVVAVVRPCSGCVMCEFGIFLRRTADMMILED